MATTDGVKMEDALHIKPEPTDAATPSAMGDDDYEDTGELVIPASSDQSQAWLAKLPKWLWESWADIAEDEELELGKVRVYNERSPENGKVRKSHL